MNNFLSRFIEFLELTDDWIINKFEKFCHWTQKLVGLNSVFWGRGCVIYSATLFSFDTAFPDPSDKPSAWRWVLFGLVVLIYLLLYHDLGNKRPKIGEVITVNIYRHTWRMTRYVNIFFLPPEVCASIFKFHRPSINLTYALALYFLAVDDLPSQPSKLRLWLESLSLQPLPSDAATRSPYNDRT